MNYGDGYLQLQIFGQKINDTRPVRFLWQEVEEEGAERLVIEIVAKRQMEVRHQEFFRLNNNFLWPILLVMKPKGPERVIGEETVTDLDAAAADNHSHFLRSPGGVEHESAGAEEDEQGEEKIFRHGRGDNEGEGDETNQPIPVTRPLTILVFIAVCVLISITFSTSYLFCEYR